MTLYSSIAALLLLALAVPGAWPGPGKGVRAELEDETWRGRSLEDELWRSSGVEVVVDRAEPVLLGRVEPWLVDLRVRTGLTGVRGRGGAGRVVVGGPASSAARGLAERIGATLLEDAFEFAGERFGHPSARLVATFEDPERPGLPVTVVYANDAERLARGLVRLPVGVRPGAQVWVEGLAVVRAELGRDGALRVDTLDDRRPRLAVGLARSTKIPTEAFDLWAVPQSERFRLRNYLDRCVEAELCIARWFGKDTEPRTTLLIHDDPREVAMYSSEGDRHAARGAVASLVPEARRVHALLAPNLPHDGGAGVAAVTAMALAGPPARAWMLDAIGVAASGWSRGAALNDTLTTWGRAGARWDVSELFSMESLRRGPGSRDAALRALGFLYLANTVDRHELRRFWREGVPLSVWEELAPSLEAMLTRLAEAREAPARRAFEPEPFAGVVLLGTAEGGYWVDALPDRLAALAEAGASGVVFVLRPTLLVREPLFGAEEARADPTVDDALEIAWATGLARATGLRVGLLVSPINGPLSSWPENEAASVDQLARFAERYATRLGELALAAEASGVEFLVLGSELRELTRSRDADEVDATLRLLLDARRTTWTRLVASVREVFAGPIGYAASTGRASMQHWPEGAEVSQLGFLDALDFLAVTCFPVWGRKPQDRAAIRVSYERHLEVVQRVAHSAEKPWMLLAVGAPSADLAWRWAAEVGAPAFDWQSDVVVALTAEVQHCAADESWLGSSWWYSKVEPGEVAPNDFEFFGKPAAAELRAFWDAARGAR